MKNNIVVKYVEFEPKKDLHFGPIEIAYGRINYKLWFAESYFPSRNAQRAWRVYNVTPAEGRVIAKAIRKFENEGKK